MLLHTDFSKLVGNDMMTFYVSSVSSSIFIFHKVYIILLCRYCRFQPGIISHCSTYRNKYCHAWSCSHHGTKKITYCIVLYLQRECLRACLMTVDLRNTDPFYIHNCVEHLHCVDYTYEIIISLEFACNIIIIHTLTPNKDSKK